MVGNAKLGKKIEKIKGVTHTLSLSQVSTCVVLFVPLLSPPHANKLKTERDKRV